MTGMNLLILGWLLVVPAFWVGQLVGRANVGRLMTGRAQHTYGGTFAAASVAVGLVVAIGALR